MPKFNEYETQAEGLVGHRLILALVAAFVIGVVLGGLLF